MSQGFVGVAEKLGEAIGMVQCEPLHLANLFAAGSLAHHDPGQVLCQADETAESVFLLATGTVAVSKPDKHGTLRPIAELAGPAMLGHMGVIDGSPRSATCTITGPDTATVIHIRADVFLRLIKRPDPTGSATRHLVLASLIRQLGNTNRTVAALLDGQPDQRAASQASSSEAVLDNEDLALLEAVLRGWSIPPTNE